MEKTWSYLVNPILNATVSSYIRFFVISTFHYERLKAKAGQPFFDDLLKIYEPFHLAFVAAYNDWKAAGGLQIGSTAEMDEVLGQLSHDKAEQWDLDVQHVYRRDTPHYLALLPHHRQVFQNGSALERISAISAFSKAIGTDAALAAVKADVDAFHTHTTDIASHKDGKQGDTKFSSEAVEAARVKAGTEQFRNLGLLTAHYAEEPTQAGVYFDQETIRNSIQTHFTHAVAATGLYSIVRRTLQANQQIIIHNTGTVILFFFAASQKKQHDAPAVIEVQPGEIKTLSPVEFGNSKELPYFNVINNAGQPGQFDMDIK